MYRVLHDEDPTRHVVGRGMTWSGKAVSHSGTLGSHEHNFQII